MLELINEIAPQKKKILFGAWDKYGKET